MASVQLPNYLRANRKRLDLTQDELAFLLGVEGAPKVCRYETFAREPSLRTLLAFEAIFQKTPSELFAGLYREIQTEVIARAKTLSRRINAGKRQLHRARTSQALVRISTVHPKTCSSRP
jgi:transcriptional regulator with XRE-family HTH domain